MRKLNLPGLGAPLGMTAVAAAAAMVLSAVSLPALAGAFGGGAATSTVRTSVDPRIVDLGIASPTDVKSFTVSLAVRNKAALTAAVAAVADPKNASYRKFITPAQFAATYGQTPAAVAQVTAFLQAHGFTVDEVAANSLLISVTGTNAQIAATFGSAIHNYTLSGTAYQAPAGSTTIPAAIASVATAVSGLSDRAIFRSHAAVIPNTGALAGDVPAQSRVLSPDVAPASGPGSYSVLDVAAKYNVNPLYAKGLSGAGRTIGIATLAGYSQADAYAYWSQLGIPVSPTRITDVKVAGGFSAGFGPGTEGAGETTLDVEQSGGIAPGANIRVYVAPNTDAGFMQVFSKPINENLVDVLSISWGSPEIVYAPAELDAFDALFSQAALQGIPLIAASGDAGAFDINRSYTYPDCTTLLTVDFPAVAPGMLAAGGTTLPNTVVHVHGPVTVPTERAWGWDYLHDYITTNFGSDYGTTLYYTSYFTVGGGGGVSVNYPVPAFQQGVTGLMTSAQGQSLLCNPAFVGDPAGAYEDLADLPAGVAGRNVPDVSLNADPYSGYSEYFTGQWSTGSGGTSFVAPQLNGMLTLITSGLSGRIGPINPQLYAAFKAQGYAAGSPFKAITAGDNEYYKAAAHYNPATGLGSLDVNALATTLGVH
jgi:kumamolisin